MKIITLFLLPLCLALGACAVNPVTGKQDFALVSESDEIRQGREFHQQIIAQYGVYDDPEMQAYVDRIGQQLAAQSHRAHLEYSFTVLDSPDINAFALPGGYIYVTRGIMAYLDSEAELAGVLGHEIGHVTARHSVRQQSGQMATGILGILIATVTGESSLGNLSQTIGTGLVRGYGREHELEADRLGARYLHNVGYDPDTMLEVIGVLKDQEVYEKALAQKEGRQPNTYHGVFSTHPRNDERLKTVVREAKKLSQKQYRGDNRRLYHDVIDGMTWGPSLRQGVVVKNRFSHPDLAFALQLPESWKVINTPQVLIARDPNGSAILQIGLVERESDETLPALLRRLTGNSEIEVTETDNGASAMAQVKASGGQPQPARLSAIALDQSQALTLLGTAAEADFAAADKRLLAVNRSFKRLSKAEVAAIKAPRLRIVEGGRHSFESLARGSAIEYDAENLLRVLNRAFPSGDIGQIDRLKTVVADD